MKFTLSCLTAFFLALPANAADKPAIAQSLRQRFVSTPYDAAKGNRASFSALHQLTVDQPGVLMLMAHAGIGDSFPVQEKDKPKHFDVTVLAGDDDLLQLEILIADGTKQQLDLKRDGLVSVKVDGHKFTLAYPTTKVSSDNKTTTDQAMIIVNQFP